MAPCSDAEDGSEVTGEDESTLGSVREGSLASNTSDIVKTDLNGIAKPNRDATYLPRSNDAKMETTQNNRITFENIARSGDLQIDVETESGHMKFHGKLSEVSAFMHTEGAAVNGEAGYNSAYQDDRWDCPLPNSTVPNCDIDRGPWSGDYPSTGGPCRTQNSSSRTMKNRDVDNGAEAHSRDARKFVLQPAHYHELPISGMQLSSVSGRTTIKGTFPAGTVVDISMPCNRRQIIVAGKPITASNISAGDGSFQFVGVWNGRS
jgi:hypothetical protein